MNAKLIVVKSSAIASLALLAWLGSKPAIEHIKTTYQNAKSDVLESLTTVRVVKEYVQPIEVPTEEMIDRISIAMEVNPIITKAIARQESGTSYAADALRYEPHLESRFASLAKNPETRRMLATSIGIMQVIPGFHLKTCSLDSYAQLFERRTNISCGLKVLKDCFEYHKQTTNKVQRWRKAFQCYNGGDKYADEIFNHIGQIVLEQGVGN